MIKPTSLGKWQDCWDWHRTDPQTDSVCKMTQTGDIVSQGFGKKKNKKKIVIVVNTSLVKASVFSLAGRGWGTVSGLIRSHQNWLTFVFVYTVHAKVHCAH